MSCYVHKNNVTSVRKTSTISINVCSAQIQLFRSNQYLAESSNQTFYNKIFIWFWVLTLHGKKLKWSRYRPGVAQRVGRGIALHFHDCGTRRWWVVSSTSQPHFTPRRDPILIVQEAGWTPGLVWTGGKSRLHRDSIPDRPARSSVAILTELPGPLHYMMFHWKYCLYIKNIFQYLGFPFEDSICWRFWNKN